MIAPRSIANWSARGPHQRMARPLSRSDPESPKFVREAFERVHGPPSKRISVKAFRIPRFHFVIRSNGGGARRFFFHGGASSRRPSGALPPHLNIVLMKPIVRARAARPRLPRLCKSPPPPR